jgi:hypothetical protein
MVRRLLVKAVQGFDGRSQGNKHSVADLVATWDQCYDYVNDFAEKWAL